MRTNIVMGEKKGTIDTQKAKDELGLRITGKGQVQSGHQQKDDRHRDLSAFLRGRDHRADQQVKRRINEIAKPKIEEEIEEKTMAANGG